jgi:NADP-dependent 3-hydroxy acid dehydrogenase YdfG
MFYEVQHSAECLDVLVSNAGAIEISPIEKVDAGHIDRMLS